MAQQIINIGSGPLAGDGESIRSAFAKTNENFTELYSGQIGPTGPSGPLGPTGPAGPGADQDLNTTSSVVFDNLTITNNSYFSNDVSVLNSNLKIVADNNTGLILSANSSTDILNHGLLRFSKQYGDTDVGMFSSQKIGSVEFDGYQVGNGFAADYETNKFFPGILVTPFSFNPNSASTKIQFLNRAPFLSGSSDPFNNLGNTTDTNVIASLTVDPLNITAQSQKFTLSNPHQGYSSLVNPTSVLTDGLYGIQRLGNPVGGETFDLELSSGYADQGLYNSYLYISSRSDNIPYWLPFYGGMTTATNKQIEFENIVDPGNSLTSTIYSGSVVKGANIKLNTLRYEKIEKSVFKNGVERSGDAFWNTSTKAGDVLGTISFQGGLEGSSDSTSINGNVDGVIIRAYAKNDWAGQQTSTTTNVTFNDNLSALRIEVATTTTVGGLNSSASGLQQRYKNVFEIDATTATFNTDVWINGNILQNGSPLSGGSSVTASETAPVSPSVGNLWYDTASGRLYVYYDSYWTDASPALSGSSVAKVSSTAPSTPVLGDLWYDTASGRLYVYYDSYWADATPVTMGPTGPTGPQGDVGPTGPVVDLTTVSSHIIPSADLTYDLGSTSSQWRSLYVGTGTIYIGGVPLTVTTGGNLTVDGNPVGGNMIFGDDSTLLIDGVDSKINLNGTVLNGVVGTSTENLLIEAGKISLNSSQTAISLATYADSVYTSASWSGNNIDFTGVEDIYLETLLERFDSHFGGSSTPWAAGYSNITVRINNTQTLAVTGASFSGGTNWRVEVAETPASDPTAVTSAEFFYDFVSTLELDRNNNSYAIALDDSNFRINTRRDIRLESGDDIYIDGRSNMRLRNYSRTSGITIETDFNNEAYEWQFGEDGTLTTPGDIIVAGNIVGTSGASTLVLKAEPSSNTYIQLNDTVDSTINTVANLEIRTDVSNTASTWTFGTDGSIIFPDATTQTTAYPGFDQDVNTADSPNFVNLGLAGTTASGYATLSITTDRDFYIGLTDTSTGAKTFEFGRDGRLLVPGVLYVDGNVYGGTGNRLYLAGDIGEGVPAINIPNSTEGATSPLSINNTQGGGVQIETGSGNWLFDDTRLLYFPTSSDDEYNIGESVDGFNIRSDVAFGIVTNSSSTPYTWTFDDSGGLTFPDGTTQTRAFSVVSVPTESTSTGVAGDIAYNENYFYVCTATNAWQRIGWDVTPW